MYRGQSRARYCSLSPLLPRPIGHGDGDGHGDGPKCSRLHTVNLEFELAGRFLRRRTGVLLRGTALAAFAGVALAVAALVITLALMNGYSRAIATSRATPHAATCT